MDAALAVAQLRGCAADLAAGVEAARAVAAAADAGEGEQRLAYTPGRRACVEAGAPAALVAFAGREDVKRDAGAARWVGEALRNVARAVEGKAACVAALAPAALVELAGQPAVRTSADAAQFVAGALANIANTAGESPRASTRARRSRSCRSHAKRPCSPSQGRRSSSRWPSTTSPAAPQARKRAFLPARETRLTPWLSRLPSRKTSKLRGRSARRGRACEETVVE